MSEREENAAGLHRLAERAGIAVHWHDVNGKAQVVSDKTLRSVLTALEIACGDEAQIRSSLLALDDDAGHAGLYVCRSGESLTVPLARQEESLPYRVEFESGEQLEAHARRQADGKYRLTPLTQLGYHQVHIGDAVLRIAVAPAKCIQISDAVGNADKQWGIATQLYGLRAAAGNLGGIGDFGALAELAELASREGAAAVCISPIHAMFDADPHRYSPYSPSSRLFLNPAYVDPRQIFGEALVRQVAEQTGVAQSLAALDQQALIDWPAVTAARMSLLRALFDHLMTQGDTPQIRDFQQYRRDAGSALEDHARFEALQAQLMAEHRRSGEQGPGPYSWRNWPQQYRDPRGAAVARFAEEHAKEVSYFAYLQWLAARGLAQVQRHARECGMPIGIIADLAVGTDGGGSHGWSRQAEMLIGVSCGAPGDLINPLGQGWGLSAFSPLALRHTGYAAFIEMLRATMAHAGGIRVDHVLGLRRLWLVPDGAQPSEGAYLRYPFEDLVALIALESWRHRAIVIGENLGTVPEGFNDQLYGAGVLGTSVLWFERARNWFNAPHYWSPHTVATTTTHDLPSVTGWWRGRDLDWRTRLDLLDPNSSEAQEREERERDKATLWTSLGHAHLARGEPPDEDHAPLNESIAFVGRTPAPLVLLPVEDLCGYDEQPNLPGTTSGHPNWQRRVAAPICQVFQQPDVQQRIDTLRQARKEKA